MERYQERRSAASEPHRADRADAPGQLQEVAAKYPTFRLFNPFTGGAGGVGRSEFSNFTIPSGMISADGAEGHGLLSEP